MIKVRIASIKCAPSQSNVPPTMVAVVWRFRCRRYCQTLSHFANPLDLCDQHFLLDMNFLGTPQLRAGVNVLFFFKVSFLKHPIMHTPSCHCSVPQFGLATLRVLFKIDCTELLRRSRQIWARYRFSDENLTSRNMFEKSEEENLKIVWPRWPNWLIKAQTSLIGGRDIS